MDKNPPANEGDRGSILDLERSKARAPQLTAEAQVPRTGALQQEKPPH